MKMLIFKTTFLFFVGFYFAAHCQIQTIQVKTVGNGSPMLFFPHIGCSSEMWTPVVDYYSKQYTCHVIDFAGFAGLTAIDGNYTQTYVNAVSDYMKTKKIENAIFVGQNYGAFVALKVALHHPDKVSKIVVSDFYPDLKLVLDSAMTAEKLLSIGNAIRQSTLTPTEEVFKSNMKLVAKGMNFIDTTYVETFVDWQARSDRKTLAETLIEQLNESLTDDMKTLKTPVLALHTWYFAKRYRNMPISECQKYLDRLMYKGLPHITHAVTEDAKDFIHIDQPEWFIKTSESFIQ
jgi:pimeloyl-ACP methyl ester carboxylesterase